MTTVLQIIPALEAGGAERTTLEIAEALVRNGDRALVASRGGRLEGELEALGGELIRMDAATKDPVEIWKNAGRLSKLIRDEAVDILHARSRAPAWSALIAARRTKTPFVTTYHGTYKAKSALKRFYNSVMARGDIVIANSAFIRGRIVDQHGTDAARIVVIPRGVDMARHDPEAISHGAIADFRLSLGLPPHDERPVILLPARLTRWKGQVTAIAALAQMKTEAVLALAGDAQGRDAYVAELEEMIARAGLSERAILSGHIENMPAAYAASDLVIAPSVEPEAFGRTAAEAQAMGRMVIAADHGGAREVVDPGVTGWLAPPGEAAAWAEAMDHALSLNAEARAAMGAAGRARASKQFSTNALQTATLRVYKQALESPHG